MSWFSPEADWELEMQIEGDYLTGRVRRPGVQQRAVAAALAAVLRSEMARAKQWEGRMPLGHGDMLAQSCRDQAPSHPPAAVDAPWTCRACRGALYDLDRFGLCEGCANLDDMGTLHRFVTL